MQITWNQGQPLSFPTHDDPIQIQSASSFKSLQFQSNRHHQQAKQQLQFNTQVRKPVIFIAILYFIFLFVCFEYINKINE